MAGGACVAGGMHSRGCAWEGACVAGGHVWQGCVWQGDVCGGGACMGRACMPHMPPPDTTRYGRSMHGRCPSYWNAFLLVVLFCMHAVITHNVWMI